MSHAAHFVDDYLPALLAQAGQLLSVRVHCEVAAKGFTVSEWRVLSTLASRDAFTFNVAAENQVRGLSWAESFYFCTINLTTVGFGDITPANTAARALASMTALCGVVLFGFIAAAVYRRLAR